MGFRSGRARVRAPRERNLFFLLVVRVASEAAAARRRNAAACIGDRDVSVAAPIVVCVVVVVCSGVPRRRQRVLPRKTRGGDALTAAVTWCDLRVRCAPFDPVRVGAGGDFWAAFFFPLTVLYVCYLLSAADVSLALFFSLSSFFIIYASAQPLTTFTSRWTRACAFFRSLF